MEKWLNVKYPKIKPWLVYATITTFFWGAWGALIELPERSGFPATMGYVAWSLTMIPCALIVLYYNGGKLQINLTAVSIGLSVGLLGAGGQLILFQALRDGPAYIVFPYISLYPLLSIALSYLLLKEKIRAKQWFGVSLALIAILLFSYHSPVGTASANGFTWLVYASFVFIAWGLQAYLMKFATLKIDAESVFFYMMVGAVMLIPFAVMMTDFSMSINWGFSGAVSSILIHLLNSIGALALVHALKRGKAIIVVPMTGLSPLITVMLSLFIYQTMPAAVTSIGLIVALIAVFFLTE